MTSRWIVRRQRHASASLRLFCFSCAGAGASAFREWHAGVPHGVEVCAVQLPGRESRLSETPITVMETLIEAMSGPFSELLDLPYAFFGHSLGALVAFELARQLRRSEAPLPLRLMVAAHSAPQERLSRQLLSRLSDAQLLVEIERLGGTPPEALANRELMLTMLPVLRADCALREHYRYKAEPPLEVPITAFGGVDDTSVSLEELKAWQAQTTAGCVTHLVPGGHFFVQTERKRLLSHLPEMLWGERSSHPRLLHAPEL